MEVIALLLALAVVFLVTRGPRGPKGPPRRGKPILPEIMELPPRLAC